MELADGVRATRLAQREGGHVEAALVAVRATAELDDALQVQAAALDQRRGELPHQARVEALVAGRDRRVDGEDGVAADLLEGSLLIAAGRRQLAGALDEHERRVALVEVPGRGLDAQRAQQPDAADAEDHLLVQAHLAAADVELVRDGAIGAVVLGDVGVQEQERHAPDLRQPDGGLDRATRELDRDEDRLAVVVGDAQERQAGGVVVGVGVLLVPVGIDGLAEVAVAVEEPDADEREGHVRGRLAVVAGQHAQAAGVDAERLVEAELGAEVGDRAAQLVAVPALEPVAGAVGDVGVEAARGSSRTRPGSRCRRGGATSRACPAGPGWGCGSAPSRRHRCGGRGSGPPGARSSRGCTRAAAALPAAWAVAAARRPPRRYRWAACAADATRSAIGRGRRRTVRARRVDGCQRVSASSAPRTTMRPSMDPTSGYVSRCSSPICGRPSPTAAASVRNR